MINQPPIGARSTSSAQSPRWTSSYFTWPTSTRKLSPHQLQCSSTSFFCLFCPSPMQSAVHQPSLVLQRPFNFLHPTQHQFRHPISPMPTKSVTEDLLQVRP